MSVTLIHRFDDNADTASEWEIYGLWRVEVDGQTVDIGAVVGVPEADRDSAKASGSYRPFVQAWWADASDHDGVAMELAGAALGVIQGSAVAFNRWYNDPSVAAARRARAKGV